jgi:hypothetical protein
MTTYSGTRKNVARFAADIILHLGPDWRSTTITVVDKSEVSCACTVTGTLSEDTVALLAQTYSLQPITTS